MLGRSRCTLRKQLLTCSFEAPQGDEYGLLSRHYVSAAQPDSNRQLQRVDDSWQICEPKAEAKLQVALYRLLVSSHSLGLAVQPASDIFSGPIRVTVARANGSAAMKVSSLRKLGLRRNNSAASASKMYCESIASAALHGRVGITVNRSSRVERRQDYPSEPFCRPPRNY
jgi:hypothetical protein